jgi:hypothetical protein
MLLIKMKTLKSIFSSINGATMIQVIMATAMLTAMSLVIVKLGGLGKKQEKSFEVSQAIEVITSHINQTLLNREDCMLNITPNSIPPTWLDTKKLRHYKGGVVVDLIDTTRDAAKFKEKGFTLDKLELIQASPVSNIAELKLTFSKTSKFRVFGLNKIFKSIFILQDLKAGAMYNCYADFKDSVVKNALNAALAKSCGPGLKFNGNLSAPRCIIDPATAGAISCPTDKYITDVKLNNPSPGTYSYTTTCKNPITCGIGQIGMVVDGNLQCINKCANPKEVGVFSNTGFQCKDISCPNSGSTVQYLAGINNDGTPICKNLASTNVQCGVNGFRLISTDAAGSVQTSCCSDCPSGAGHCTDQQFNTTADCGVKCYGSQTKMDFIYSSWSSCQQQPNKFCTKSRTRTCPRITSGSYECCNAPIDYQPTTDTCIDGVWTMPGCPTNNSDPTGVTSTCTTSCCDPAGSSSTSCPGRLQGGKTWDNCAAAGGIVTNYSGSYYCEFNSDCPGGWNRITAKSSGYQICGGSHGLCTDNCCNLSGSGGAWNSYIDRCSYCTYQDYETWGVYCYCGGSVVQRWANIYKALCN